MQPREGDEERDRVWLLTLLSRLGLTGHENTAIACLAYPSEHDMKTHDETARAAGWKDEN